MSLLAVEHVVKHYGVGAEQRVALRDVSFEIQAGELVAVRGKRRSGRSTLLRIVAGLEPPDSGVVRLNGTPLSDRRSRASDEICYCRTRFRAPEGRLVLDQMIVGQLSRGVRASTARSRASEALRRVDAGRYAALKPGELDGAERVRVAVARALVREPKLLVIDEPTLGIDLLARDGVLRLLRAVADDGIAVLTSTADTAGLADADRALALSEGELDGTLLAEHASVIPLRRATGQ